MRMWLAGITIFLVAVGFSVSAGFAAPEDNEDGASWWDSRWTRRVDISVKEQSGISLIDYQVRFVVPYDSDMKPDYGDVRFVAPDHVTPLAHWREKVQDSSAVFWVKVPSLPSAETVKVFMYYGSSQETASDIHETFIWGDDFQDSRWTVSHINQVNYTNAVQYVNNGEYHMEGPPVSEPIAEIFKGNRLKDFPDDYICEVNVKPLTRTGRAFLSPRYKTVADKYECALELGWNNAILSKVVDNVWTGLGAVYTKFSIHPATWYKLGAMTLKDGSANQIGVQINDVRYLNKTDPDLHYSGLAFLSFGYKDPFHIVYDNVRVREYTPREPALSLGAEEGIPAGVHRVRAATAAGCRVPFPKV